MATKKKNPAAVALGKRSGINMTAEERRERARTAGKARVAALAPEQLSEIARKGARARWKKAKGKS